MEMHLYTLHAKPGRDLEAIGDGFDWFAFLVPPLWAIWHGLWAMLRSIWRCWSWSPRSRPSASSRRCPALR